MRQLSSSDDTIMPAESVATGGRPTTSWLRLLRSSPFPPVLLLLGVGSSLSAWEWLRSPSELKKAFQRDAAALAYQVRGADNLSAVSMGA